MRNLQINELIGIWRSFESNKIEGNSLFDFTITENSEFEFYEYNKNVYSGPY